MIFTYTILFFRVVFLFWGINDLLHRFNAAYGISANELPPPALGAAPWVLFYITFLVI